MHADDFTRASCLQEDDAVRASSIITKTRKRRVSVSYFFLFARGRASNETGNLISRAAYTGRIQGTVKRKTIKRIVNEWNGIVFTSAFAQRLGTWKMSRGRYLRANYRNRRNARRPLTRNHAVCVFSRTTSARRNCLSAAVSTASDERGYGRRWDTTIVPAKSLAKCPRLWEPRKKTANNYTIVIVSDGIKCLTSRFESVGVVSNTLMITLNNKSRVPSSRFESGSNIRIFTRNFTFLQNICIDYICKIFV